MNSPTPPPTPGYCAVCADKRGFCTDHASSPISVSADRPAEKPCQKRLCRLVAEHVATLETTMLQWKARAVAAEAKLGVSWLSDSSPAADRPVENSELREVMDDLLSAYHSYCNAVNVSTRPMHGADFSKVRAARSRIEELFASLQQEKDFERDCTDLLKAEISRLRADRLTDDEAAWLATMIGDEYESITDRGTSALSKIRRISEEGNPK